MDCRHPAASIARGLAKGWALRRVTRPPWLLPKAEWERAAVFREDSEGASDTEAALFAIVFDHRSIGFNGLEPPAAVADRFTRDG